MRKLVLLALLVSACATTTTAPATKPNDKEWSVISADYQWLETLRKAQAAPQPTASRKQQIETTLENSRKIEEPYNNFMRKLSEYYERTGDPRAAQALAREKILLGDQYLSVLSRYDRALEQYRQALQFDPANADAQGRVALAEKRRFVSMAAFANVKSGMKEDDVRKLVGLPREDWIKQVVQNTRVYSVWIYPKEDGGASAVYFDNGIVYHTNWNAATPPPS
jgi:tetratricopeptide (TPR) repeat protein